MNNTENDLPGINGETFKIVLEKNFFEQDDENKPINCKVVKTYPLTWWRKLLLKCGFSVHLYDIKTFPKDEY